MQTKFRVGLFMFRSLSACLAMLEHHASAMLQASVISDSGMWITINPMFPSLLLIIKYNTNMTISVWVKNLPFFVIRFPVIVLVHLRCKMMLWWTYSSLIVYLSICMWVPLCRCNVYSVLCDPIGIKQNTVGMSL